MIIVCDRCRKATTDYDNRNKWKHIETSEKGYGKLGDYFLCPECSDKFYKFINSYEVAE